MSAISDPNAFVLDLVRRSAHIPAANGEPDYTAAISQIRQSPSFRTKEEIDNYMTELRAEW